jgi:hypothetical protein
VNDLETKPHADRRRRPVHVKEELIRIRPVDREQYGKNKDLTNYIGEKEWEHAIQLAPDHSRGHGGLEHRVRDPQCIKSDLVARVH